MNNLIPLPSAQTTDFSPKSWQSYFKQHPLATAIIITVAEIVISVALGFWRPKVYCHNFSPNLLRWLHCLFWSP